ncbi:hypothetical protein GALMADRAFT_230563 [Galerina marginata CBS 339.88]|uniref:Uncharacterized protein n=1 Tax=Galerina marginata (strain CBS 339.88) TaxID=685588 RepID=A0A067SF62_GALM3|nr:hypothetical protein GALMADRAFT_230563 [Galerina marginata CBS 339.88]
MLLAYTKPNSHPQAVPVRAVNRSRTRCIKYVNHRHRDQCPFPCPCPAPAATLLLLLANFQSPPRVLPSLRVSTTHASCEDRAICVVNVDYNQHQAHEAHRTTPTDALTNAPAPASCPRSPAPAAAGEFPIVTPSARPACECIGSRPARPYASRPASPAPALLLLLLLPFLVLSPGAGAGASWSWSCPEPALLFLLLLSLSPGAGAGWSWSYIF